MTSIFLEWITNLSLRLRALVHRRQLDHDLEDEMRFHLAMREEKHHHGGAGAEEARYAARRRFGNVASLKESCPEMWTFAPLETLGQDLRYALRLLRKNPGFSVIAVLSLALGIGGNAAMFSVLNRVLLRELPYPEPDRLMRVTGYYPKGAVIALQQRSRTMDIAGFGADSEFNLSGQGEAVRLAGSVVSANLFSLLGAGAEQGRAFVSGEDHPGPDRIAILSQRLWLGKFGADPNVIGRSITVDGVDRQVVGIMPADFAFPSSEVQVWIPLHLDPGDLEDHWGSRFMPVVARLRVGATLAQAQSEIRPLVSQVIPLFPYTMPPAWNADATVLRLQQDLVRDVGGRLILLQSAVGLVLLIACANVAGLLLSRAAARKKEMALRAALGAARGRIVRQLLTESVVLALAGGGLGLALAFGALPVLKVVLPAKAANWPGLGVDGQVLAFVAALAVATGIAFGLVPALSASRPDLTGAIKTAGRRSAGPASARLRGVLIAAEMALAVVLAVSAGLLIKSLRLLTQVNPGFRPAQVLAVRVSPNQSVCQQRPACIALYDELVRRSSQLPGVSQAAAVNAIPLGGEVPRLPVELEGHPLAPGVDLAPLLWAGAVTPDYFPMMRIPVLRGRGFTAADSEKAEPVIVVSAETARAFWPGEEAVGKHMRVVWDQQWRTIVGVAGDVRQYDLADHAPSDVTGTFYMPYAQSVGLERRLPSAMTLLVRTSANPGQIQARIRELVAGLSPNVPVGEIRPMEKVVSSSVSPSRSLMWLFVSFAGFALVLAAVGTYGVVSYSTAQRTFEIAVRVALGATRGSIFAMVLRQSLQLALAGLAIGVLAALAVTRMLSSFLYGITATDPLPFLVVSRLLLMIPLLAGYVPARRAASIDPLTALRVD